MGDKMEKPNVLFVLTVILITFFSVATNSQTDTILTSKIDSLHKL